MEAERIVAGEFGKARLLERGIVIGIEVIDADHAAPARREAPGDVETDEPGGAGDQDRLSRHRSPSPRDPSRMSACRTFCRPRTVKRSCDRPGLRGSRHERQACCARPRRCYSGTGRRLPGALRREGHGSGQAAIADGCPNAAIAAPALCRDRRLVFPLAPAADGARRPRRRLRGPCRHQCRRGSRCHRGRRLHAPSRAFRARTSVAVPEHRHHPRLAPRPPRRSPCHRPPRRAAGERARSGGRVRTAAAPMSTPSPASAMPSSPRPARRASCAPSSGCCCGSGSIAAAP